jgi:hypothetical protein
MAELDTSHRTELLLAKVTAGVPLALTLTLRPSQYVPGAKGAAGAGSVNL